MASINSAAHEAISPAGIKVSTNSISSADGDVLYLEQISVDSNGHRNESLKRAE